jgi:hypothetical protein
MMINRFDPFASYAIRPATEELLVEGVLPIGVPIPIGFRVKALENGEHGFKALACEILHTWQWRRLVVRSGAFEIHVPEFWFPPGNGEKIGTDYDLTLRLQPLHQRWYTSVPICSHLRQTEIRGRIEKLELAEALDRIEEFTQAHREYFWSTYREHRYAAIPDCRSRFLENGRIKHVPGLSLVFAVCESARQVERNILESAWAQALARRLAGKNFKFHPVQGVDYTTHRCFPDILGESNSVLMVAVGMALAGPDGGKYPMEKYPTVERLAEAFFKKLLYQAAQRLCHCSKEQPGRD